MSTLDIVALQRYGTTTILGISVVHGVAEPLRYVFIVAGRVIVCGYAATVITVIPQSIKKERMILMFKSKYANLPECMSKFDENGVRTETRIRIAHYKTQEEVDALAAEGFVAHTDADFDKYLGNNTGGKTYRYDAAANAPKEYVRVPTVAELYPAKKAELKAARDAEEVAPLEYNGKMFDYDIKSVIKLNEAHDDLIVNGGTQPWICADNTTTVLTAEDIAQIKHLGKVRSNDLHLKYFQLKTQAEAAETVEELNAINW